MTRWSRRAGAFGLLFTVLIGIAALSGCGGDSSGSRQNAVATLGTSVMPFDLNKTQHTFARNASGGVETVRALSPDDAEQIGLIRGHLTMEADKFRKGDFSDPIAIHGPAMPGVSALKVAGARLQISYREEPDGASISYSGTEAGIVDAIHQWFTAQTSDHGSHAASK